MDSLYFLIKSQSFGESPNLFNMNSDFTSETTVRNIEIPSSIFVVSEQVLDASAQANIQRAATKITNMDDGISMFRQFCQFNKSEFLPKSFQFQKLQFPQIYLQLHVVL